MRSFRSLPLGRASCAVAELTLLLALAPACSDSTVAQPIAPRPLPVDGDSCPECTPAETNDDSLVPVACGPGRPGSQVDPASGLVPAWQVDGPTTYRMAVPQIADGLAVAEARGGGWLTLDAETGGECAELVPAGARDGSAAIDAYSPHATVVHGALVGSTGHWLGAVGIRTGVVRWRRALFPPSYRDSAFELRDSLKVVETSTAMVVAANASHGREVVVAIDPRTGRDLWRKSIIDPGVDRARSARGEAQLASDGTRVFVRANGTLTAYDAQGTATWNTSWTPVPDEVGVPTMAARLPLVAVDPGHVAMAFDGRIQIVDGASGAPVGEVAVSGTPTELVADGGLLFASVEARPGTATVVAIDMGAARALWSFDAAYSARSLRVDEALVYLRDGNARVWGLGRATGEKLVAIGTGAYDFAVARSRAGASRIIPIRNGLSAFDATGREPQPLAPFLRWSFERDPDSQSERCRLRALSWLDGSDRVVWEREVPARMHRLPFSCEVQASYQRQPRLVEPTHMFGSSVNGDTLLEANDTGVLALNIRDGSPQFDVDAWQSGPSLFFDEGRFEVDGLPECTGTSLRAQLFGRCGDRYVYFNGTTALVLSGTPLRVEARGAYGGDATEEYIGRASSIRAAIPAGSYTFRLEGITHMN